MANASVNWPSTLPSLPLTNGYQESFKDNVIRSGVESGPMKTRQRYTRVQRMIQLSFLLTNTQKTTFATFFNSIQGGAIPFNWTDPIAGTAIVVRLTSAVTGPNYVRLNTWQVSFQLEVLP